MKRIEMIRLINKYIETQTLLDQSILGTDILDLVEEKGMLPPTVRWCESDEYCNTLKALQELDVTDVCYPEWESE